MAKNNQKSEWPAWESPTGKIQLDLAKALMPYIKILNPKIVEKIVKENNIYRKDLTDAFRKLNIRENIYLWEDSPVAFPGIRRHVGGGEINLFRKKKTLAKKEDELLVDNALLVDDNSFPKEIWSFVLRGRKATLNGPVGYSLAHIVDHKDYNSRHTIEIKNYVHSDIKFIYAGLHTSCANTIWVPNTLMKPTDHKGPVRQLMLQLVNKYYSGMCKLLPNNQQLNLHNIDKEWEIENFKQPELVGDLSKVKDFLEYRNKLIHEMINSLTK